MSLKRARESCNYAEGYQAIEPCSEDLAASKSKIDELVCILQNFCRTKVGKVLIMIGPTGSGKSTVLKVLCKQYNLQIAEWKAKDCSKFQKSYNEQILEFLRSTCTYKKRLNIGNAPPRPPINVILIDSPPTYFMQDEKENWRSFLPSVSNHDKLVCIIISDTSKKTIDRHFSHIQFSLYQLPRPGKRAMKLAISRLKTHLNCPIDSDLIIKQSNFNLNKMVNLMLIHQKSDFLHHEGSDDFEFQFFHTLGKFLYNKSKSQTGIDEKGLVRKLSSSELKDKKTRGRLYFDPEDLINRCYCEQEYFWLYLHENFWDFYGDLADMQEFLDYCTLADCLDTYRFNGFWGRDLGLPSYIVARAVMDCNSSNCTFASLHAMRAPMVNSLREKMNGLAEDARFESALFGVSRECYLAEICFGLNGGKIVPQEADEDYLWKEIGNGLGSISFG